MDSHIESKLGHIVSAPVLSQPYLHVEDAMCEAPARALILWDVTEGMYQFMEVEPHINTHGKLRALVNGVQEVADLCCVAFNVGDGWDHWRD